MRTSIKIVLGFFALVAILGIGLTLFSGDSEARTCVWDGGDAGALASTAANWDTDTAPIAGDDINFDGVNDDACTWDLATNSFGTFTIGAGYSGTITQSSDMYISGYSQAGGTFNALVTKWVYCAGNLTKTAGTINSDALRLDMLLDNTLLTYDAVINFHTFSASANCGLNSVKTVQSRQTVIDAGKTFTLCAGSIYKTTWHYLFAYSNDGIINGAGTLDVQGTAAVSPTINLGDVRCVLLIKLTSAATGSNTVKLGDALTGTSVISIISDHATYTCTLDLNGKPLTASTVTVGTRGILSNSAATDSTVTCTAFTSTSGTFNHTGIILAMTDGTITATANEQFETIYTTGYIDIINQIEVTESFMFVNVDPSYGDIDVYLDTVYDRTISSPYELGIGIKAGVKYEYLPDIQITLGQFYEDLDFSIYAGISSNLPVTYNITGTASSWLTYHEGQIVGMPPDIGNYTYTITATHESGSVDIVSGYIPVGTISTAEYNFDFIWGLLLWSVITLFMLFGYLREIPLMQMVVWAISFGNIIATIRIENFAAFVALFAICNTIIFFIGMARWRSG